MMDCLPFLLAFGPKVQEVHDLRALKTDDCWRWVRAHRIGQHKPEIHGWLTGHGDRHGRVQGSPFHFSTESRQLPEMKFRPKFRRISLIPNGKRIQIQKTKFRWIPTEISVISTGKWCPLWFSYCFGGQMKNFWIPTLFSFLISTTFVSGTFSFE